VSSLHAAACSLAATADRRKLSCEKALNHQGQDWREPLVVALSQEI
jgi:hypothetical protein